MTARSVYWHDGMFMWPHHMQLEERFRAEEANHGHRWNVHHNWGLRSIDLDLDALKSQRLVLRSLQARMRDGTLLRIPEDCQVAGLDLKDALLAGDRVTVFIALPVLNPHQPNVPAPEAVEAVPAAGLDTRFLLDVEKVEDENTGEDPQPVHVRRPNVKLLTDQHDPAGYEILPIARIRKGMGAEGPPQLDVTYIPPILACDAWKPLAEDILQSMYHRIGSRAESLAQQVITRNISFDTRNVGDAEILNQLGVLNEAFCWMNTLAFAEGVHPLEAYSELCRLVGQLAIFQPARRSPELPRYDHDDLGTCFYRVKQHLDALDLTQVSYEERPFIGEDRRMQVAVEAKWLEPIWQMFVGVQSPLKQEDVIKLFTIAGKLDMKIGSAPRVDLIFERGMPGLKFAHAHRPPRILPATPDLTYFQVERTSQKEEWDHVLKSLSLAIRLNRGMVDGNLQGQRAINIKLGPTAKTTMQFSLFVVPQEK